MRKASTFVLLVLLLFLSLDLDTLFVSAHTLSSHTPSLHTSSSQTSSSQTSPTQTPSTQTPLVEIPLVEILPLQKPIRVRAQIVDGQDADVGEWPWQVYLEVGPFLCGGTLIHQEWVLTAAHCLLDETGSLLTADQVTVVLGLHNLSDQAGSQSIQASQLVMHEEYSLATNRHDIGLIKLSEAAQLGDAVSIVSIVDSSEFTTLAAPQVMGWVTGWGRTSEGGAISEVLQEVALPITTNQICNVAYEGTIHQNMFCAGFPEGGKDACQGDSGGPLFVSDGTEWKQAGIISWGFGCARPDYYGVYTRIYRYEEWLEQYIDGLIPNPTPSPTSSPVPPTPLPTQVPTQVPTAVPTATPTLTVTAIPTFTPTSVLTITMTPIVTPTLAPTITPTITLPITPTVIPTAIVISTTIPVATAPITVTSTPAPTATQGISPTISPTILPTNTPMPAATFTPSPTDIPPTAVPPTAIPPTDIPPTDIPPTATPEVPEPLPSPVLVPGEIRNSDFDLGANGDWLENSSLFGGEGSLIFSKEMADGLVPHSGNFLAWLGGENLESSTLLQSILLPDASSVMLNFHYVITSVDECGQDNAQITVNDDELLLLELCEQNAENGWQKQSLDLSTYAGGSITLGFRVETDAEDISSFFVDSLSLDISTEPNLPSTATPVITSTIVITTPAPIDATPTVVQTPTPYPTQIEQGNFEPTSSDEGDETYWHQSSLVLNQADSMILSTVGANLPFAAHSGTHMALLGLMNSEQGTLAQSVRIPDAERVALRFFYQIVSTDACGYDVTNISIAPKVHTDSIRTHPPKQIIASYALCHDQQTERWVSATLDVSEWRGVAVDLTLSIQTDAVRLSGFYIDDIQLLTGESARIAVLPQQLNFSAVRGAGNPAAELLGVDAPTALTWRADATSFGWLSLLVDGGTGLMNLPVHANTSGLEAGIYTGSISIQAVDADLAGWLAADVPVELNVFDTPPNDLEPETLTLRVESGMNGNKLAWSLPNNPHIDSYRVLRRTVGEFADIGATSAASYFDIHQAENILQPESRYCYQIEALASDYLTDSISVADRFIWARSNIACLNFGYLSLSLPDVIGAPGAEEILPIYVQNASALRISDAHLELIYDDRTMRVTGISSTAFAPDYQWTYQTEDIGDNRQLLTVTLAPDTSSADDEPIVIRGDGPLALLAIQVIGDDESRTEINWKQRPSTDSRRIIEGTSITIARSDGSLEDARLTTANGLLTVKEDTSYILGDLDADSLVQRTDAAALLQLVATNIKPHYAQLRAGDITGNMRLDSADAAMILAYSERNVWPYLPTEAGHLSASAFHSSTVSASNVVTKTSGISMGLTDVSVVAGGAITSSLWISGLVDFNAAEIVVTYDPTVVEEVLSVSLTADPLLDAYLLDFADNGAGQLRIVLAGGESLKGDWSLLTIVLQTTESVAVGESTALRLVQADLYDLFGRSYHDPVNGAAVDIETATLTVVSPEAVVGSPIEEEAALENPITSEPDEESSDDSNGVPNENGDGLPAEQSMSIFLPLINQ